MMDIINLKQKLGKFAEVEFKMNDDKSYESIQKDLDKNEFKLIANNF